MKTLAHTIEPLESRIAPAVFTVTTLKDTETAGQTTLRDAINLANLTGTGHDTIVFAHTVGGKMAPLTGTIMLLSPLPNIADGVAIIGPVPGSSSGITINLNKHGDLIVETTNGDVALNDLTITNGLAQSGGGLYINDSGKNITITDCAITGNHAVGSHLGNDAYGGGIDIQTGTVTIQNSKITGNSAAAANGNAIASAGNAGGGGIRCSDTLVIKNSLISGNTVTGGNATAPGTGYGGGSAFGGGVCASADSVTIDSSVISGNKATGGNGASGTPGTTGTAGVPGGNGNTGGAGQGGGYGGQAYGGGISAYHVNMTIDSSTISANTVHGGSGGAGGAGGKGGAGGQATGMTHAGAGGDGGVGGQGGGNGRAWGGGIEFYTGNGKTDSFTIRDSTVTGNTTTTGVSGTGGAGGAAGAGSYTSSGTVHKGAAGARGGSGPYFDPSGGGIYASGNPVGKSTVVISQVTVAGNSSFNGGGLFVVNATASIDNCTVSQNKGVDGGGFYAANFNSYVTSVTSTIIAGNTATNADPDVHGAINDSNDLIGLVTAGTDLANGTTDFNGTATVAVNPLLGPLGLHDGGTTATMLLSFLSPAIGNGSNPDNLQTDQNGDPRVTGSRYDMGAVEEGGASTFYVITLADTASATPIPGSLRDAIDNANLHGAGSDSIVFAHVVHGKTVPLTGTIKLLQPLPQITDSVTIIGPTPGSPKGITINLNKQGDLTIAAPSGDGGLSDLTITNGLAPIGGALYVKPGSHCTITGCTITGNHAVSATPIIGAYGGGITVLDSYLAVHNSTISGNTVVGAKGGATHGGNAFAGGIECFDAALLVTNSVITGNTVTGGNAAPGTGYFGGVAGGGGVQASAGSQVEIYSSVVSGNKLTGGNGGSGVPGTTGAAGMPGMNGLAGTDGGSGGTGGQAYGGGIRVSKGSELTMGSSTISGNTILAGNGGAGAAGGKGGAGGHATAMAHAGKGGDGGAGGAGGASGQAFGAGVESYTQGSSTTLFVYTSSISGNTATSGKTGAGAAGGAAGAGSYTTSGTVHKGAAGVHGAAGLAKDSTGGGIWAGYYTGGGTEKVTLSQVTVSGNTAQHGGGVDLYGALSYVHNCTIAGNTATISGGGLVSEHDGSVEIIGSIISGNTAPIAPDVSGDITEYYSLIQNTHGWGLFNTTATNLNGVDPMLGKLGLHDGGTTQTMLLSFLSQVIGAGNNPDNLLTDQNDNPRTILGGIDMGAVEEG